MYKWQGDFFTFACKGFMDEMHHQNKQQKRGTDNKKKKKCRIMNYQYSSLFLNFLEQQTCLC